MTCCLGDSIGVYCCIAVLSIDAQHIVSHCFAGMQGSNMLHSLVLFSMFAAQQSTFTFDLLSGPTPVARRPDNGQGDPSNITYYDSE